MVQIDALDLPASNEWDDDWELASLHKGDMASLLAIILPTERVKQPPHVRIVSLCWPPTNAFDRPTESAHAMRMILRTMLARAERRRGAGSDNPRHTGEKGKNRGPGPPGT